MDQRDHLAAEFPHPKLKFPPHRRVADRHDEIAPRNIFADLSAIAEPGEREISLRSVVQKGDLPVAEAFADVGDHSAVSAAADDDEPVHDAFLPPPNSSMVAEVLEWIPEQRKTAAAVPSTIPASISSET